MNDINYFHCSPNVFRVIKSSMISSAGHVVCRGEVKCIQSFGAET